MGTALTSIATPPYGFGGRLSGTFPSQVIVDVTELCNLACTHCPHPDFKRSEHYGGRSLDPALCAKAIDEVAEAGRGVVQHVRFTSEGEPLLHKDKELLRHEAPAMLAGLKTVMDRVGASEGVVGAKDKYEDVIRALQPLLPAGVRTFPLTDTYPAGDEFILVHDVTGRVIPPGGLPRDVGALVVNVETLVNVGLGRPVTHKVLTVAGAVKERRKAAKAKR